MLTRYTAAVKHGWGRAPRPLPDHSAVRILSSVPMKDTRIDKVRRPGVEQTASRAVEEYLVDQSALSGQAIHTLPAAQREVANGLKI